MYITKKLLAFMKGKEQFILKVTIMNLFEYSLVVLSQISLALVILALLSQNNVTFWYSFSFFILSNFLIILGKQLTLKKIEDIGAELRINMRKELFENLCSLGAFYRDSKKSGELITTMWQKVEWVANYYLEYIPRTLSTIMISLLVSIYIFSHSVKLGLFFLLFCFCIFLAPIFFYPLNQKYGKADWQAKDTYFNLCLEGIKGILTLKSFNIVNKYVNKIEKASENSRKTIMSNLVQTTANSKTIEFGITGGIYLTFLCAGLLNFDLEILVIMLFLLQGWGNAVSKVIGGWLKGSTGISGIDSILDLYESENVLGFEETSQKEIQINGDILFENISFSYGKEDVLKNISFTIKKGQTTAFVGASGSGKTTIAKLLFGFYKAKDGNIFVGEQKIQADNVKSFQNSISTVWQDNHIFLDTCYENIRLAKPNASEDEIYKATKKAKIHDYISSLPMGYQTVIGDGGATFSGGEKQRIAIARAFLKNSDILILDEATSSLDRSNEVEISQSIQSLSENKTVLVIAHRLATIESADEICVLNKGEIVERGTHDELQALNGYYCKLMQAGGDI